MVYVALDTFDPDHISVVVEEGETKYFSSKKEAEEYCSDNIQTYCIVPLSLNERTYPSPPGPADMSARSLMFSSDSLDDLRNDEAYQRLIDSNRLFVEPNDIIWFYQDDSEAVAFVYGCHY